MNEGLPLSEAETGFASMAADVLTRDEAGQTQQSPDVSPQSPGQIIELRPLPDPLSLTREGLLALPDRNSKFQALLTLRRRSYNPLYVTKLSEVFPEAEPQYPLSALEQSVFDAGTALMSEPDRPATEKELRALGGLNGISPEKAVDAFRQEGKKRDEENILIAEYQIGGYKMGRQVLRTLDRQILADRDLALELDDIVDKYGSAVYLHAPDRDFLERQDLEDKLESEYKRDHPLTPAGPVLH